MQDISRDLNLTVDAFYQKYRGITDKTASLRPDSNEWSLKEIIGHLVNSASNNHQRFVGLQTVPEMQFPEYQKYHLDWIGIEKLNDCSFSDLFLLWKQYNILISHIISNVDTGSLNNVLLMEDGKRIALKTLIIDYFSHLRNHLNQFEETLKRET